MARIRINRPDRLNALATTTFAELTEVFVEAGADPEVWLVVLTGTGDRAFCAGGDLKELAAAATDGRGLPRPMTGVARNLFEVVLETYKPTIAAVNGSAVGAGFELMLACDLRVGIDGVRLGLPEAKRGLGANFGATMLPRLIPRAVAMEMIYTGRLISGADALGLGLLNRVVPRELFDGAVAELVCDVGSSAPLSLRRSKEVSVKGWELSVHNALRLDVGPDPYASADRIEGVRAFLEKRPPVWRGA